MLLKRANSSKYLSSAGFTLVELLVAMAVLMLIILVMAGVTSETARIWRYTASKSEEFRATRTAFETMTRRLSQATLNTYWDYDNPAAPTRYQRRSELRFTSGTAVKMLGSGTPVRQTDCVFFNAPFGVVADQKYRGFENLLCTWGYYLEYGDDSALRPPFLAPPLVPARYRSRLMELSEPAEKNAIYSKTSPPAGADPTTLAKFQNYSDKDWFQNLLTVSSPPVHVVAENVIALLVIPRLSREDEFDYETQTGLDTTNVDYSPLAPSYSYDSSPAVAPGDPRYKDGRVNPVNQLPPVVQVVMVAIDEISAGRLNLDAGSTDYFGIKTKFQNTKDLGTDLLTSRNPTTSLESTLIAKHVNYRIFNTNVIIRGAKWSREQTN